MLEQADGLMMDFDEGLWNATIETVTVWLDGSIDSQRKNGVKLRQELRKVEFRITKNDNPANCNCKLDTHGRVKASLSWA